jgi:hypothetical protein
MTKRRSFVLVALSVAASLLFAASPAPGGSPASTDAFARRAAGAFLLETDFVGISLRSLTTLSSDGTFSSEDTSDYGALGPDFPRFQSDQRGSWKRSGRRDARFLSIGFDFDADGQPISILRLRGLMQFDRGFGGYRVVDGLVEVFFDPTVDPLDPANTPDLTLPWTGAARRIPARLD